MLSIRSEAEAEKQYSGSAVKHECPECGADMAKVDQICESGFVFTWYECPREGCLGQWLEKTAGAMGAA